MAEQSTKAIEAKKAAAAKKGAETKKETESKKGADAKKTAAVKKGAETKKAAEAKKPVEEKKAPEKFLIQKGKNTIPLEEPFACPRAMTLINDTRGMSRWHWEWVVRRLFSSQKANIGKAKPV